MKIHLIPSPLFEENLRFINTDLKETIQNTQHFFVENERHARRYIGSLNLGISIRSLHFYKLDRNTKPKELSTAIGSIPPKSSIGVISEAGCPGIADPGAQLVLYAHQQNWEIVPLVGPSSIFLALMGSGLGGQQFAFHGYLPIQKNERLAAIRQLEKESLHKKQTQLFMETPYRNQSLWEDLIRCCNVTTQLSISLALHSPEEFVGTKTIGHWKKSPPPSLHKKPAVFVLSA